MYAKHEDLWTVTDEPFPREAGKSEQLKHLLKYAVLAPSVYNTQPWQFKVTGAEVAMYVDRARALPVTDPLSRNLIMSCGAALFNLRIAIRNFGYIPVVRTFPDLDVPNLLAFVRLGERLQAIPAERALFDAIRIRHTVWSGFSSKPVPDLILDMLQKEAALEGACILAIRDLPRQQQLAELIREAREFRLSDGPSRLEIEKWTHASSAIPRNGAAQQPPMRGEARHPGQSHVRGLDDVDTADDVSTLETGEPPFIVLATPGDNMASWLSAGQALGRVLLAAAADGLSAAFLGQAIGIDHLRARVRDLVGNELQPQLILRIGYSSSLRGRRTRRVPVDVVASGQ